MEKKVSKLYIDTSVPNAYFDERNPERQDTTKRFWLKLKDYQVFISDLVIAEIQVVKLKTKREVSAVNILLGYDPIEIVEPAMI